MPTKHDLAVGFVGSGPDAAPIISRLSAAFVHTSVFYPLQGETGAEAIETLTVCRSLDELRSRATVIVTRLATEQALRQFLFDLGGVTKGPDNALAVLDLSPILPWALQDVVENCRRAGVTALGGRMTTLAKGGKTWATLYVDDTPQDSQLRLVVQALADEVVPTGPTGSAKSVGLVTDLLVGVNAAVAHEALGIGSSVGLDTKTLIRLLLKGSGATQVIAQLSASPPIDSDPAPDDAYFASLRRGLECGISAAQRVEHSLFFGGLGIASLLSHGQRSAPPGRATARAKERTWSS